MTHLLRRLLRTAAAGPAAIVLAGACAVGDAPSPVGVDILPGGEILDGGLQVAVAREFALATDYTIFPSRRAEADRLTTAHDWPDEPGYESRALVRFDLTQVDSLAAGTTVVEAGLRLVYDTPDEAVEIAVHRVTSEWSEEAATWERRILGADWATSGGDFEPEPLVRFTVGPDAADSTVVDLPVEAIEAWTSGAEPNHGLILIQETPGERVEFVSRGDQGVNANGPALRLEIQPPGAGVPAALGSIPAREDTFIVEDEDALAADPGLLVNGAEPVRRAFLLPELDALPSGATVARAQLVLSVAAIRLPEDSLQFVALSALSAFQGENTIIPEIANSTSLGRVTVTTATQPGDSVVFESAVLTREVRAWLRTPESNLGLVIRTLGEEIVFGGVRFHGLEAPEPLRPRIRVVYLPSQAPGAP